VVEAVRDLSLERLRAGWKLSMNENAAMAGVGALRVVFGIAMTAVSGPTPGAARLYSPLLRLRLICFGVLMSLLGLVRLVCK
jgi:hypothetical protein